MESEFPPAEPRPLPLAKARLGDRSLFEGLQARSYLNHSAISPPSMPVRQAVAAALEDYATHGVDAFLPGHAQRQRLKGRLGGLLGVEASDLAFVPNTTAGIQAVALCYPWRAGDRILLFTGEFPTNVTPWQRAAELFGLELRFLGLEDFAAPGGADFTRLDAALAEGVRMVAVSAVQFQTGLRMPIAAIADRCRDAGAELCVDAIQAVGVVPVDASLCDYLACGGHKWLMGPGGAGFLYAHPDRVGALRPNIAGWLSHRKAADFLFDGAGLLRYDKPIRSGIDFLEGGAPNTIGYAGLEASVALLEQLGPSAIFAHVSEWLDGLEAGLLDRGFHSLRMKDSARRSGILAVQPPGGHTVQSLAAGLNARGMAVSTPDGLLRFAPHWPNAFTEVPLLLDALDELLRR